MLKQEDQPVIYPDLFGIAFRSILSLFRALLEGEKIGLQDVHRKVIQPQRERIIGTVLKSIH